MFFERNPFLNIPMVQESEFCGKYVELTQHCMLVYNILFDRQGPFLVERTTVINVNTIINMILV